MVNSDWLVLSHYIALGMNPTENTAYSSLSLLYVQNHYQGEVLTETLPSTSGLFWFCYPALAETSQYKGLNKNTLFLFPWL
jgi:hypothetical protein